MTTPAATTTTSAARIGVAASDLPLPPIPVTETANELTENIDLVDARGFVRLLRGTDAQIFNGWHHYSGLYDATILHALEQTAAAAAELLAPGASDTAIVMTGCGTSGRIAYFVARAFNRTLRALGRGGRPVFHYLVSGTDTALLESEELPEDDPITGAKELEALLSKCQPPVKRVMVVGITCGLSAPYVAGQLDWAMNAHASKALEVTTVLMGFNPLALARRAPIELWKGRTFYDVAHTLEQRRAADPQHHIVLNPVVGPEPVTGSSRMKGGSATKIMLEAVFSAALVRVAAAAGVTSAVHTALPSLCAGAPVAAASTATMASAASSSASDIAGFLTAYEATHRATYLCSDAIARLVEFAAQSLKAGGHIYYLGEGDGAVMGFIDASEMPDTFGTPHTDVRAFVVGGWAAMANAAGDLSAHHPPMFRIGVDHFETDVLHTLRDVDTVIAITDHASRAAMDPALRRLVAAAKLKGAKVGLAAVSAAPVTLATAPTAPCTPLTTPNSPVAGPVAAVGQKRTHSGAAANGASVVSPKASSDKKQNTATASASTATAALTVDATGAAGLSLKKHKTDLFWPLTRADSKTPSTGAASDDVFDAICHIELPRAGLVRDTAGRFRCHALLAQATKWVLNAITTGAHVANGTVLGNRMINMTVANNKLFYRSIAIIRDAVTRVAPPAAATVTATATAKAAPTAASLSDAAIETCLLRAIYGVDAVDTKITSQVTSAHIITATKAVKVLPLAILLASQRFATIAEARKALATESNVRALLRAKP